MKLINITLLSVFLSFLGSPASAVTMVDEPKTITKGETSERVIHGKLLARYADGRIETTRGNFSSLTAKVVDHRPIDAWYKTPSEAKVTLFYTEKRLNRIEIY